MSIDPIANNSTADEFRTGLLGVEWFSHIGEPTVHPFTISSWDDWPGPDSYWRKG